jgi:hypothetical protein
LKKIGRLPDWQVQPPVRQTEADLILEGRPSADASRMNRILSKDFDRTPVVEFNDDAVLTI